MGIGGSDDPIDRSKNEKEELKAVLNLLKLKNENPEDISRDKKFLTAAFSFLEKNSDCIWCQYTQLCGELLRIFSFVECPPLKWFRERTLTCLTSCRACIEAYYGIRPKLFVSFRKIYDEATVKEFEGKIHQFDVSRLRDPFEIYLKDKESRKKLPIKFILFEILLFPGWIVSPEISVLFENVLEQIISSMKMVKISEKLPGVIVCSAHPNQTIRLWAKSVLNSEIQGDAEYARINYSWDTVSRLARKLDDESYSDAMYVCLKASKFDFINSCTNWNWTDRIFSQLQKDDSKVFMEALRLYSFLIKFLSSNDKNFPWYKLPESLNAITSILENPSFAQGSHTEQDSANFVLDWIPLSVSACLSERKFKVAHKIVSDLMEFILESRAPYQWKVKVVERFSDPLASLIENAYLLGKLSQLLLFLLDKRFSEFRKSEHEISIISGFEKVFVALVKNDLSSEIQIDLTQMDGTPSSAVFDLSNYRKFLITIENHPISNNFLNSIANELAKLILNPEYATDPKIWTRRTDLLSFIVKESVGNQGLRYFSDQLVLLLIFIYLSGFKLDLPQSLSQTDNLIKIIGIHPEKSLKATNKILSIFLKQKYKMKNSAQMPLEKSTYFLNSVIGRVFAKDLEILKIYQERLELVFDYFLKVLFAFYIELNYFVSLPNGPSYYDLSGAISFFGCTLISLIGFDSFQRGFTKVLKPLEIQSLMLPCLSNMLINIFQRSNQSKYSDIPSLVTLSSELIILSGNLKVDFETSRMDQILKVLLTSNAPASHKSSITKALAEYSKLSGKTIAIPSEPPKNVNFYAKAAPSSSKMDVGMMKKLEALERMDDEFINKQLNHSHNGSCQKPASSSKLGQLRQEMAKEGVGSAAPAKKSRFTPIVVSKAPKLMSQADILRAREDSSDSDCEVEKITSDTFKNAPQKPPSQPFTAQAHRSIKLISINEEESTGTGQLGIGQPISSKVTVTAQMQRDWQSAQRLHKYVLSLDYSTLADGEIIDLPVQNIPDSFPNYDKYLQVFEPLLQLECRSQIISAKEEGEGRLTYFKGIIQNISMVDDFHEVLFNFGDDAVHRLFTEQDLLVGHPVAHLHQNNPAESEILGLVINTASRQKGFEVTIRFYLKGRSSSSDINFQLLTRLKQGWKFAKLCNLVTNNREFLALQNLPLYSSCNRILQPKFTQIDQRTRSHIDRAAEFYTHSLGLNLPQASAIAYALMNPNFFTLIQGPPGTGKTRTIEGFLAVLFGRPSSEFRIPLQYKRIMICAPSNAAIDEIVRRLKGGVKDSYGKLISLRIVRVGSLEMIHEDVKDLSVDGIVENMIQGHIASALEMLQNNRKQLSELKGLLDKAKAGDLDDDDENDVDKEEKEFFAVTRPNKNTSVSASSNFSGKSVQELKNQYWQVKENIRKGNKFIEDSRQNLRLKVLNEAQVVCCTLSASGHDVISRIDGDFEMVIIDEACQAIELSALIPLQYGCKRAVLVGDPNQLPPTVISQTAVTFAYEQSLFQRLQKIDPSAVQLLSLQYRMHPDISVFPSSYFYGGRLANGPNVRQENTRPWHGAYNGLLGPFRFFDIPGQEQLRTFASGKKGNSMMNELEARITTSLIALISNSSPNYKVNKGYCFYDLIFNFLLV